jgi:broad specificity phosphatase PhoE
MLTVWLIRHGETTGNAALTMARSGKTVGNLECGLAHEAEMNHLTPRGQLQALQIAEAINHCPKLIVTSPLWRTKQTAEPTCKRFSTAAQAEWPVQEFSYVDAERYRNATTLEQRRLLDQEYWQRGDPEYVNGAGAESFSSLITRVRLLQDRLHQLASDPGNAEALVLVFSHAWFIRAVIWSLMTQPTEISPQQMWRLHNFAGGLSVPNGSIFKVQVRASEIWFTGSNTAHLAV